MSTPINLNKARKAKARAAKDQKAVENRVRFGRTKAQKAADKASKQARITELDQKRKDP